LGRLGEREERESARERQSEREIQREREEVKSPWTAENRRRQWEFFFFYLIVDMGPARNREQVRR